VGEKDGEWGGGEGGSGSEPGDAGNSQAIEDIGDALSEVACERGEEARAPRMVAS